MIRTISVSVLALATLAACGQATPAPEPTATPAPAPAPAPEPTPPAPTDAQDHGGASAEHGGAPTGADAEAHGAGHAAHAVAADGKACALAGPQAPRDITSAAGTNAVSFAFAPPPSQMNLCNIHSHENAEHKGPGFSVFVGDGPAGGFACNDRATLTEAELAAPAGGEGAFEGLSPGDTIEVHWVHTSCPNATPGKGLGACVPEGCTDPVLRVEAQTFLVVNDPTALNFMEFDYGGTIRDGFHQAKSLPTGTGDPVVFLGSTTGPSYNGQTCSPAQATWSVRPQCAKVDIASLHAWAASGNVFEEDESHGVRALVTDAALLAPIP